MTKKTPTLVELKLAVLNHFQSTQDVEPNEQFVAGIARDECYTSHNSLVYKKKQMADRLSDYETASRRRQRHQSRRYRPIARQHGSRTGAAGRTPRS
jgi:hypothetical protein